MNDPRNANGSKGPSPLNSKILWGAAALAVLLLWLVFPNGLRQGTDPNNPTTVAYSDFLTSVDSGHISEVTLRGPDIVARTSEGQTLVSRAPDDPALINRLADHHVKITALPPQNGTSIRDVLLSWFPMLLLIGVWVWFLRRSMSGKGGGVFGFGKSKARLVPQDRQKVTFEDVAGIDEVKQELEEIVDFLRNPKRYDVLGARIPRGVLLSGPPGTGKTLLARAIAGEANVPFFTVSGSDFVEMFVGVGASRVRDMFEQAKRNAPAILFIDEIDAVGRHRGAGLGGGHDEREQTLNQLLVEMDGFDDKLGVIVIAATNRADVLDPALLRPGRFDRHVAVPAPDVLGRTQILAIHARKVPLLPDVDLQTVARGTPGFSGAELANLVNEAALLAARRGRLRVGMADFEDARDKVLMGPERRSMAMTPEEKRLTAYHEAGHALISLLVPGNDPLHKVSIVPRGRALGVTLALPERDRYSLSRKQLEARLAMLFGGRVAEELIFGDDNVTTGAANDIQQATALARRMVTEYGFSDKLGRLRYSANEEDVFFGRSITQRQNVAEETAAIIDAETRLLIEQGETVCRQILSDNLAQLHVLAEALLEYETLDRTDIDRVLGGKPVERDAAPVATSPSSSPRKSSLPAGGRGMRPSENRLNPGYQPGA